MQRRLPPLLVLCLVGMAASGCGASHTPPPGTPGSSDLGSLQFEAIDAATVRVVALRPVGLRRNQAHLGIGHGTGIAVASEGLVATAAHVVRGAQSVLVFPADSEEASPAEVVYRSDEHDVALLAVASPLRAVFEVPSPARALRVREAVYALGYPVDINRAQPQSSVGAVAGVGPGGNLQLAMTLDRGNSGGPLVNEQEQLLGMVITVVRRDRGHDGISYAVPAEVLRRAIGSVLGGGGMRVAQARVRVEEAQGGYARTIGALIQAGGPRFQAFNREARDGSRSRGPAPHLARLHEITEQTDDVAVLELVAAIYLNASTVAMRLRSDARYPHAVEMTERMQGWGRWCAQRALQLNPERVRGSDFFQALAAVAIARRSDREARISPPLHAP